MRTWMKSTRRVKSNQSTCRYSRGIRLQTGTKLNQINMNQDFKIRCTCGSDKCYAVDQTNPSFDVSWMKESDIQFDDESYTIFLCECGRRFQRVLKLVDVVELQALRLMALEVIRLGLYQDSKIEPIVERLKRSGYDEKKSTRYYSTIKFVNKN